MEVASYDRIQTYDDFCGISIDSLSPDDLNQMKSDAHREIMVTGFTALFIQSKNLEVDPLHLSDVRDHLIKEFLSYES